jgi:hypothetical protein
LAFLGIGAPAAAAAPVVTIEPASNVKYSSAHVKGEVNPKDHETFYHFEYVTQAQFEAEGFAAAATYGQFAGFGSFPEGIGSTPIQEDLFGLHPGTVYHLRLVAENTEGETAEAIAPTFETTPVNPPEVKNLQVSDVTTDSAHFAGVVNSGGSGEGEEAGTYRFYCEEGFNFLARCPGFGYYDASHPIPGSGTDEAVEADATELVPNQEYDLKLIAENAQTEAEGQPKLVETHFTTEAIPPEVTTRAARDIHTDRAALAGLINPENAPTTYWFEYGPTTAYGSSVPPAQDAALTDETVRPLVLNPVVNPLLGLAPETEYHYRIVAHNLAGTVHGDDQTFTTLPSPSAEPSCANEALREEQHSTFLPDCRAYEMVSPPDKNGGNISGDASRVHLSGEDESPGLPTAATFASLAAFGDPQGTGIAAEYLSQRDAVPGSRGWSTHAITPRQTQLSLGGAGRGEEAAYLGELSPDLTTGVLQSWSPLTSDPNVANASNLYLRTDLRAPGAGAFQLLTACPLCEETETPLPTDYQFGEAHPRYSAATPDLSHVLFQTTRDLVPGATGSNPKLYESVEGALRLIAPPTNGAGCPRPGPCSIAGAGMAPVPRHLISTDGSRVNFTSPTQYSFGQPGERASIYQLDDQGTPEAGDDTMVRVSASERTSCANGLGGSPPCKPEPEQTRTASYQDASADGSRVFFTSPEQLTDDAPPFAVNTPHLYMWSATPDAEGHHLTLLSEGENEVEGMLGASDDGHFVYFQMRHGSIQLWRDDGGSPRTEFVGQLSPLGQDAEHTINRPGAAVWIGGEPLSRVSPDGHSLLFEASATAGADLTGYDSTSVCKHGRYNIPCYEAYLYSPDTHRLTCVSCNPSGAPAESNAFINGFGLDYRQYSGAAKTLAPHVDRALTDNGRYVFFSSAEALVTRDTNGKVDVYEYDIETDTLYLITSGTSPEDSWFMEASPNGRDVLFITSERLLGWDRDNSVDLYDARIGGGFREPPANTAACVGETCRAGTTPAPAATTAGTETFSGPGSPKPNRTAKHRHHKHRKHHKRAKANRRTSR